MKPAIEEALDKIADADLFKYCSRRMLRAFQIRTGARFLFGQFQWVIHDGLLWKIEDCPRYLSFDRQGGAESK